MLETIVNFVLLSALFNFGFFVFSKKVSIWQRLNFDPCVFCWMYWMSFIYGILYFYVFNHNGGFHAVFLYALCSASLGIYLSKDVI